MKEELEEGSPQEKDKGQVMTDEGHSIISVIDIDQIVRKSMASADLAESMSHIIDNSPTFSFHMMPFMSGVYTNFVFHSLSAPQCAEAQVHAKHLSDLLDSCNMTTYVIKGDGNCCFSAVATFHF